MICLFLSVSTYFPQSSHFSSVRDNARYQIWRRFEWRSWICGRQKLIRRVWIQKKKKKRKASHEPAEACGYLSTRGSVVRAFSHFCSPQPAMVSVWGEWLMHKCHPMEDNRGRDGEQMKGAEKKQTGTGTLKLIYVCKKLQTHL